MIFTDQISRRWKKLRNHRGGCPETYENNVPIIYLPFSSSLKNHREHEKDCKIKGPRGQREERDTVRVFLCDAIETAPFGWLDEKPVGQLFHKAQEVLTNPISSHAILRSFIHTLYVHDEKKINFFFFEIFEGNWWEILWFDLIFFLFSFWVINRVWIPCFFSFFFFQLVCYWVKIFMCMCRSLMCFSLLPGFRVLLQRSLVWRL